MNIQWIMSPLVGCVIGYITNWVAIKMLFRPFEPRYIGKWQIPFTPGLIPKEKSRLAMSVGNVISGDLLDAETVQKSLLSREMVEKVSAGIDALIEEHREDERTIRQFVEGVVGEEAYQRGARDVQANIVGALQKKLIEANLGHMAAHAISDHVKRKSPSVLTGLVKGLLDDRIKQTIMNQLGEGVNNYIQNNAQEILENTIGNEAQKLMDTRLCDLIEQYKDNLPALKEKLLGGYEKLIQAGTERVLNAVDLSAIVRGRIEALNDHELERLILSVVNKELNAIVWLGAGLGFIMGFTNLLFM